MASTDCGNAPSGVCIWTCTENWSFWGWLSWMMRRRSAGSWEDGLLSPALSSKGGEGEDAEGRSSSPRPSPAGAEREEFAAELASEPAPAFWLLEFEVSLE